MNRFLVAFAGAALAVSAPASAALLNFTLTGDYQASWQMDSNPVPDDYFEDGLFVVWDVEGDFPGSLIDVVDLYFYADDIGGGLGIDDYYGETTLLITDGSQLYTGTEETPTIRTGTFALTEFQGPGRYTLTITGPSAGPVPEPATWALMLVGFGAVGYSLRRSKPLRIAQSV